jgi:hypothetical protein
MSIICFGIRDLHNRTPIMLDRGGIDYSEGACGVRFS